MEELMLYNQIIRELIAHENRVRDDRNKWQYAIYAFMLGGYVTVFVAKNIIVMNGGKVFMHASVPEVFERGEELINIGLNVPQITQLFNRLIGMGADLPRDIYTVKYAAGILEKKMKEKFGKR